MHSEMDVNGELVDHLTPLVFLGVVVVLEFQDLTLRVGLRDQQFSLLEELDYMELFEVCSMFLNQPILDDTFLEWEQLGCCTLINLLQHGSGVRCQILQILVNVLQDSTILISQLVGGNAFGPFDFLQPFLHRVLLLFYF